MNKAKVRHDIRAAQFNVGDLVLMDDFSRKKLEPRWNGPWIVLNRINEVDYILKSTHTKRRKETISHFSRLKRWHGLASVSARFKTYKIRRAANEEDINPSDSDASYNEYEDVSEEVTAQPKNTRRRKEKDITIECNEQVSSAETTEGAYNLRTR